MSYVLNMQRSVYFDALKARSLIFDEKLPFIWKKENGIELIQFNYCSKTN